MSDRTKTDTDILTVIMIFCKNQVSDLIKIDTDMSTLIMVFIVA